MDDSIINQVDRCAGTSLGTSLNQKYFRAGRSEPKGDTLDYSFAVQPPDDMRLYGQFIGFNDSPNAANFAANYMLLTLTVTSKLDACQQHTNEMIHDYLTNCFWDMEQTYRKHQNEILTEKKIIELTDVTGPQAELDRKLNAGSSALVVMILKKTLYLLTCGNSRVLLVSEDSTTGKTHIEALNDVHNLTEPKERDRLKLKGIDVDNMDPHIPTRGIGDTFHNLSFRDTFPSCYLSSEPDMYAYEIDETCHYLLIVSDGVVTAIGEILNTTNMDQIYTFILEQIEHERKNDVNFSLMSAAQGFVDYVGRRHLDVFLKGTGLSGRPQMSVLMAELCVQSEMDYPLMSLTDTQSSDRTYFDEPVDAYVETDNFEKISNHSEIIGKLSELGLYDKL